MKHTDKQIAEMTNNELRQAIAELLHYKPMPYLFQYGITKYAMCDGDGHLLFDVYRATEEDAWRIITHPWCDTYDWPGDANAAFGLIGDTDDIALEKRATLWEGKTRAYVNGYLAYHLSPARAICEAWSLWKQEK